MTWALFLCFVLLLCNSHSLSPPPPPPPPSHALGTLCHSLFKKPHALSHVESQWKVLLVRLPHTAGELSFTNTSVFILFVSGGGVRSECRLYGVMIILISILHSEIRVQHFVFSDVEDKRWMKKAMIWKDKFLNGVAWINPSWQTYLSEVGGRSRDFANRTESKCRNKMS